MRYERLRRLIICALLVTTECHSVSYRWPYLTFVEINRSATGKLEYIGHMGTATINDDSITNKSTVAEVMQRRGIDADWANRYWWGTYVRQKTNGNVLADHAYIRKERQILGDTWVEAANKLAGWYGSGTMRIARTQDVVEGNECVATGAWGVDPDLPNWNTWKRYVWNGGVTGECIGTPPVDQWCAMKTPVVEIAYGTLTLKDADGSNKTAGVTVECTAGMKYTLRLQDANNETTLDNGGRVTWQAGGQALGKTLTGEAGENGVDLTATLHGPFERTGEFKGSGILFVSYP
ncbi:hypothetical protein [Pantoea ananatis]|uniref:hypothetical protein n=1 Tax=Pantoea ananas TaxID=553 RepID=UPI0032ED9602